MHMLAKSTFLQLEVVGLLQPLSTGGARIDRKTIPCSCFNLKAILQNLLEKMVFSEAGGLGS